MYIFSKSTLGFYPAELKEAYVAAGSWPDDGTEVNNDTFIRFTSQPPAGMQRGASEDGDPVWTNIPVTETDIGDARQQKWQQIEKWRTGQENAHYILRFNDENWDYSKETQNRLMLAVDMAKQNNLPPGFFWTDADNHDVPMTNEKIIALSDAINSAMFQKGLQIHIRQREMKTEIEKMTNISDILNYIPDWNTSE